jgi:hypothetical protein
VFLAKALGQPGRSRFLCPFLHAGDDLLLTTLEVFKWEPWTLNTFKQSFRITVGAEREGKGGGRGGVRVCIPALIGASHFIAWAESERGSVQQI